MGRYRRTHEQLDRMMTSSTKRLKNAQAAQRKTGITQKVEAAKETLEAAGLAADDGIPPLPPTGVVIAEHPRALGVSWDIPPLADAVGSTLILIKRASTGAVVREQESSQITGDIAFDLPRELLTVSVAHKDQYGRISQYTPAQGATPKASVADQISAQTAIIAGETSQLLNDPGLAPLTDPGKLANGIVSSAKTAMTEDPNLLLWNEAEFGNYVTGTFAGALLGNGQALNVVLTPDGRRVLQQSRITGSTSTFAVPFPSWKQRTNGIPGDYFFSAEAYNVGTQPVSVSLTAQQGTDTAGTGTVTTHGSSVTIQPGERRRVWVRYAQAAATPFSRYYMNINAIAGVVTGTVNWDRFMLQGPVPATKTEPGTYKPPGLSAGIVSTELLAAWTVAAGRAIIADATIDQAKVANAAIGNAQIDRATANKLQVLSADISALVADKIATGTLTAATITLSATGKIQAGGTILDASGVTLPLGLRYDAPSVNVANKITGAGGWAALSFYEEALASGYRGATLRSDGVSGGRKGAIGIYATVAGVVDSSAGQLDVYSVGGVGRVDVTGDLVVTNKFTTYMLNPNYASVAVTIAANGGTVDFTHSLGSVPALQQSIWTGNNNFPLPTDDGLLYAYAMTASFYSVINKKTGNATVRCNLYR